MASFTGLARQLGHDDLARLRAPRASPPPQNTTKVRTSAPHRKSSLPALQTRVVSAHATSNCTASCAQSPRCRHGEARRAKNASSPSRKGQGAQVTGARRAGRGIACRAGRPGATGVKPPGGRRRNCATTVLVLLGLARAGGVDQAAAGANARARLGRASAAGPRRGRAGPPRPPPPDVGVPPERAEARAGRVEQDAVEDAAERQRPRASA